MDNKNRYRSYGEKPWENAFGETIGAIVYLVCCAFLSYGLAHLVLNSFGAFAVFALGGWAVGYIIGGLLTWWLRL